MEQLLESSGVWLDKQHQGKKCVSGSFVQLIKLCNDFGGIERCHKWDSMSTFVNAQDASIDVTSADLFVTPLHES